MGGRIALGGSVITERLGIAVERIRGDNRFEAVCARAPTALSDPIRPATRLHVDGASYVR